MVVSFIATVGNYEYGFFWYFYLDGTIQAEVKLTGIIQTQATGRGARVPYANPVTPELAGPHHQHLFCFRLDMCVDGPSNSVDEVDAIGVPFGPDNPYGNAFTYRATLLETRGRRAAAGGAGPRPLLENRQSRIAERLRRARRLHAHPAAQRTAAGPGRGAGHRARHVRHPAPVGHPGPAETSAARPVSSRARAPAGTACPPGRPRTVRSPTPASRSGIRSARPISAGRRTSR